MTPSTLGLSHLQQDIEHVAYSKIRHGICVRELSIFMGPLFGGGVFVFCFVIAAIFSWTSWA